MRGPDVRLISSTPEVTFPLPSATKEAAASYTPALSNPLNKNAYCPCTLLLFVGAIVITADADWEVSAWAVAVTFTVAGFGTVAGAVYKPTEVMVPQPAPAQPAPLTVQVTPRFALPVTVA